MLRCISMSNDTKWIIGTLVVLVGLLSAQIAGVNARVDDVRADLGGRIDRIETRLDGFDERLRLVEIAFGKVDQRLLTIERVVLPAPAPGE